MKKLYSTALSTFLLLIAVSATTAEVHAAPANNASNGANINSNNQTRWERLLESLEIKLGRVNKRLEKAKNPVRVAKLEQRKVKIENRLNRVKAKHHRNAPEPIIGLLAVGAAGAGGVMMRRRNKKKAKA